MCVLLLLIGVCAACIRATMHGCVKRTDAHVDVLVRSTDDVLNQRVKVGHHIKATAAP